MATDGQMEKTLKKPVVAVVGLGLIGGSMAIDLKRRGFTDHVIGVENDKVNAAAAEKIGLADEVVPLEDAVKQADIIIIAVPVGAAVKMLPEILDMFRETGGSDKIVIDTCSTKGQIVRSVHYHPLRHVTWRLIRWPELNIPDLGRRCLVFLTEEHVSLQIARNRIRRRLRQ